MATPMNTVGSYKGLHAVLDSMAVSWGAFSAGHTNPNRYWFSFTPRGGKRGWTEYVSDNTSISAVRYKAGTLMAEAAASGFFHQCIGCGAQNYVYPK